jgi:hypothetical protein
MRQEIRMMTYARSHPLSRLVSIAVLVTFPLLIGDGLLANSAARAECDRKELEKATDYYYQANFQAALAIVNTMTERCALTGALRRDTFVVRARCHSGLGQRTTAVEAFCEVIQADPSWRPDPDFFTNDELETFRLAEESCVAPPQLSEGAEDDGGGIPKWLWIAIGGGVAVGLALALGGGGDDGGDTQDGDLPGFPEPPPDPN